MRLCGEAPPGVVFPAGRLRVLSWLSAACELGEACAYAAKKRSGGALRRGSNVGGFSCLAVDEAHGDGLTVCEAASSHGVLDGCRVVGAQMRELPIERAHIVHVNGATPFVEAVQPFRVVGEAREEAA